MKSEILINGVVVSTLGLTPLFGTIDNVLKPADMKKLVTNANASMDGEIPVNAANRKVAKRDFNLLFRLAADSEELLYLKLVELNAFLLEGIEGSGINEITFPDYNICIRAVFNKYAKYAAQGIDSGVASISLNFTEFNPKNRKIQE